MTNCYNTLKSILKDQKNGIPIGIYSICSSNKYVIETSLEYALRKKTNIIIESTCNQVNQFGGYTGMRPLDFVNFVFFIADKIKFPRDKIIIGGDHLGPYPWKNEPSQKAMEKACYMVKQYILAGYTKIHLDASMCLGDDAEQKDKKLNPEIIAKREAILCLEAEKASKKVRNINKILPVYVIGTEVPIPGGKNIKEDIIEVTSALDLRHTIELSKKAFYDLNLKDAWRRVIAVVAQLGVEFGKNKVFRYDRKKVQELSKAIKEYPNLILEGHSTDFQIRRVLREMVEDGVAIFKIGPALTFALREALFALCYIEREIYFNTPEVQSNLITIIERAMIKNPKYWEKYYNGTEKGKRLLRKYSFLDRSRYYWNMPEVKKAVKILIKNLNKRKIPLPLISQFMPIQYNKIREGQLENNPLSLIKDKISCVLDRHNSAISLS